VVVGCGDGTGDRVHAVTVLAEVSQEDFAPIRVIQFVHEFLGGGVGEVAVATEDALFYRPGALGVLLQHDGVVVGLEHEYVDFADALAHEGRCVAEVGGPSQAAVGGKEVAIAGPEYEPYRVVGVVGNPEATDGEVLKTEGRAAVEGFPTGAASEFFLNCPGGEAIGKKLNVLEACETANSGGVVAVFVGEEDGLDVVYGFADGFKTFTDAFPGKPSVDKDLAAVGFKEAAVARAATA